MSKQFKIYSAPRADDGRYRFSCDERMYIKEFPDLPSMLQFWQDVIVANSCTRFGMRYELSMTEFSGADWDFIGDPRYADHPVLNGKRIGQRRTLLRSSSAPGEGGSIHIGRVLTNFPRLPPLFLGDF